MLGQQLINGVSLGLLYALLAVGLSLAFSTTRVVNFAHGEMFTLGAFLALTLQRSLHSPFIAFGLIAIASVFLLGFLLSYLVLSQLRSPLHRSVATIALSLGLRDGMLVVFGSDSASFLKVFPEGSFSVANLAVPRSSISISLWTLVLLGTFGFMISRTQLGIRMRATAQDGELAATTGVNTRLIQGLAFGIGASLAAAAGVLVGPTWQVQYALGITVSLKAFTAALLGGLGNLWGALVGGMLLGITEALISGYVSSSLKDVVLFSLLILILIFLPRGVLALRPGRVS